MFPLDINMAENKVMTSLSIVGHSANKKIDNFILLLYSLHISVYSKITKDLIKIGMIIIVGKIFIICIIL